MYNSFGFLTISFSFTFFWSSFLFILHSMIDKRFSLLFFHHSFLITTFPKNCPFFWPNSIAIVLIVDSLFVLLPIPRKLCLICFLRYFLAEINNNRMKCANNTSPKNEMKSTKIRRNLLPQIRYFFFVFARTAEVKRQRKRKKLFTKRIYLLFGRFKFQVDFFACFFFYIEPIYSRLNTNI